MFFSRPSGHKLVIRDEQTAFDYSTGDFTKDDNWHDLDLSAIVPAGAIAILLRLSIKTPIALETFSLRKNGYSNVYSTIAFTTQIANGGYNASVIIPCDTDRIIEYWAENVTWTNLDILVLGWFV